MHFYDDKGPGGYWYRFAGDHNHNRRIARPCEDECSHASEAEAFHHYCEHLRQRLQLTPGAQWRNCSVPQCPDHVSVTILNQERCPTWEEMCWAKRLFFHPNECVVQFHPSEEDYVNCHPYCLHLWKPQGRDILTPQKL